MRMPPLPQPAAPLTPEGRHPATGADLVHVAEAANAPDRVLDRLKALDPEGRLGDAAELWDALGLSPGRRA